MGNVQEPGVRGRPNTINKGTSHGPPMKGQLGTNKEGTQGDEIRG